jgi:hypothetical protein
VPNDSRPARRPRHRKRFPWGVAVPIALLAVLSGAIAAALIGDSIGAPQSYGPPVAAASSTEGVSAAGSAATSPAATDSTEVTNQASPSDGALVVEAPADLLPAGSRAEVTVDALRIREAPSTDAPAITTVARGEMLYVSAWSNLSAPIGPISAGGFDWYPVDYVEGHRDWPALPADWQERRVQGYAAAGSEDELFVSHLEPTCPAGGDIDVLAAMAPWDRLACVGGRKLTLEVTYGCGVCDALAVDGTFEPGWLASHVNPIMSVLSPPGRVQAIDVSPVVAVVPPDATQLTPDHRGLVVRVTGHFNDPRAADCVIDPGASGEDGGSVDDAAAEWYCRELFVVETWEAAGPDPDYPTPP